METKKRTASYVISTAVIVAFLAVFVVLSLGIFSSCGRTTTVWVDGLQREDYEEIAITSPSVRLPAKPENAPTTDKTKPTAFGTATVSDECYTLDDGADGESLFTVSYKSTDPLPAYAYAYVPVTNYDGNAYLKIKVNCESVERLAVLAVYYEQYDLSRPAVTVYNNSVMEGENIIVCELGGKSVLSSAYGIIMSEKLTDKSICGFMLMIDSNPKQVIDEYSGKFTVTEIAVVDQDDPDLNRLNADPYISAWKDNGYFASSDITTSRDPETDCLDAEIVYSVTSAYSAVAEASIANYKSEYTTVKMDIKGSGIKTLTVAIKYNLKSSSDNFDYSYLSSYGMTVGEDWESYEFDFSTIEEFDKAWQPVPGSYVKNLNPSAIYFFVDSTLTNSGTLSVRNITFEKPEEGGAPRVTSTWSLGAAGISKSGVAEGGIGTLNFNKWQGWNAVTVNVSSYATEYTSLVVRVKFYSEYSNLGIALGYGSSNTVLLQSKGMVVPDGFGVRLVSHTQVKGEDENGAYTFHTFEIDFSETTTAKGGDELLCNQPITKILLYIDAVAQNKKGAWVEINAGGNIDPARQMQFVGIEFKKPQE